jgi:hypothetical protein
MGDETVQASEDAAEAMTPQAVDDQPAPAPPIPRWLLNIVGNAIAGVLGLALGYLILHWLYSELFPLPW